MIDWQLLYYKYGQKKSGEKFEDIALEYVRDTYSEYTWEPTGRTRDGNRDFHNLEDTLLNIWGEAKYKKNSNSLTRKDLDPTILSGLIDGTVSLIVFITNGNIPDSLITRMTLGANMKGIKISFVTGKQLSDWLLLNSDILNQYFDKEVKDINLDNEQLIEFKKISFFEPISLDFHPNYNKVHMNVDDVFILNCVIYNSQVCTCNINLEEGAPLSFINSQNYENPNSFELKPGLNAVSFLIKAMHEYNNAVRIELQCDKNSYHCVSPKIVIKQNKQLNIYYFEQVNSLRKIKLIIDNFDSTFGSYAFFIHGHSGMGKSYILNSLSLDYCLDHDLSLVTFESNQQSNINYLLLCRIIIFLQYGNIFWDHNKENIKKFCLEFTILNTKMDVNIMNNLLNGCFDTNIAKTTIEYLAQLGPDFPIFISSKKHKNFRILLLDDIHNLTPPQGLLLEHLVNQQLNSSNNNILVLSGRKNEFIHPSLEKKLVENISNYYELDALTEKDIEGTTLQNFKMKERLAKPIIKQLSSNLLLLNEILSTIKYTYTITHNIEIDNDQFIEWYINIYSNGLVFQEKFFSLKAQYYLLDILYFFKKGISVNLLSSYPQFDKKILEKDIDILINCHCVKRIGKKIITPFHDYMIESYKHLRKGKEFNQSTGDFLVFLLNSGNKELDINYLLVIISKCGRKYFNNYKNTILDLMMKYIHQSEYGAATIFAELFYNMISSKKKITKKEKYYLYLYVDCLVHCDNKYRAKKLLHDIVDKEEFTNFEKYEAAVSLLNQRFWNVDIKGIVEDSKMHQTALENMFMDNLDSEMLQRFKKTYESCFNRRMVTLMLLENYDEARKTYAEGLIALKDFCNIYNLNYHSEIATIIMDYARGNMAHAPKTSYLLFLHALDFFTERKIDYIRRFIICQIDLILCGNLLNKKTDYQKFNSLVNKLKQHNFLLEYIKGTLKIYACRIVDYNRINKNSFVTDFFIDEFFNQIEKIKIENSIILQGRELYLYNYLAGYFYIVQNRYAEARACILNNLDYINKAGNTYKIPLNHNLTNLETIRNVEWFQEDKTYEITDYLIDSRFW